MSLTKIAGTDAYMGIGAGGGPVDIPTVIAVPVNPDGSVSVTAVRASATFTPAASAHAAGDVVGAAAEFALAANSGGHLMITTASIMIEGGNAEATAWRLYLYGVTPPSALADDAVFDLPNGDRASFLGYVDLGTAADLGSTQWAEVTQLNKHVKLTGTSLFGYLVCLSALTPAAVAHNVTLRAVAL